MPRHRTASIVLHRAHRGGAALAKIVRSSAALERAKARAANRARAVQHTAVAAAAAAAVGAWARSRAARGEALPTVAGIDPLLLYGASAWIASTFLPGRGHEIAGAAADGLLAVYAYRLANRE